MAEYINDLTNVEAASNSGTETDSSVEEETWGGVAPPPPPVFRDFHLFSLKCVLKNTKNQIILNVLPPQFLGCPLSFREVVTCL